MNIAAFERAAALDNLPVFAHPYREVAAAARLDLDRRDPSEMRRLVALHLSLLGGARVAATCAVGEPVSLEVVVAAAMLAVGCALLGALRLRSPQAARATWHSP